MQNATLIRLIKNAARERYAFPGGYPMYLLMADGASLCITCTRKEFARIGRATRDRDRCGWAAACVDVNWEDSGLYCDNCNARIESAYADDAQDTAGPKYFAMYNMPGYMPDSEPCECDTFDEAKRAVIEDLKRAENDADNEADADAFCHMAEEVNLESAPFCTPTMPDGYRYSVQEG